MYIPRKFERLSDASKAMLEESAKHKQHHMVVRRGDGHWEVWSFDYWLDMCKGAGCPIKYQEFHRWSRYDHIAK